MSGEVKGIQVAGAPLKPADKKPAPTRRISSFDPTGKSSESKSTSQNRRKTDTTTKPAVSTVNKRSVPNAKNTKKDKPQYDKDVTAKFHAMLKGELTDLPPLSKSIVRIFLSSTFSDMREERNMLTREVYPVLKDFCADHDLEFEVVDMRWGVTEDSQNDHSVEKLCLLEVENCQKTSLGPNFFVISGDRYGFRPIPTEIDKKEFDLLKAEATKLQLEDLGLLDEWYKLDENAIPPHYNLQPIRSKFSFFGDYSPGCDDSRTRDTTNWWLTFHSLQSVLRGSADALLKAGSFSKDRHHQYFLSVTECEIQKGILEAADPCSHVAVYARRFEGLSGSALIHKGATRHIDVVQKGDELEVDTEAKALRDDLTKKLCSKLGKDGVKTFNIPWEYGGIDPEHPPHKNYLGQLSADFTLDGIHLVERALDEKKTRINAENYYSDYDEVLHHLRFCEMKCQAFCGQEKVLDAARAYITEENSRQPFVIYAQSGAGKTSIMAMIMKKLGQWLGGKDHIGVIRFLGTSPETIRIYDMLFSMCGHLADSAQIIMEPVSYKNLKSLIEYIPRLFRRVASKHKMPVVVLLDSVDQLSPADSAFSMNWVPALLPPNFKLILSTLPEEHRILERLRKILPDPACYVEVPALPENTGREIVKKYLGMKKRTLTEAQVNHLLTVFRKAPSPLFLKLLLDEAAKWKSFTPVAEVQLRNTVVEAINTLFEGLQAKFGNQLTSSALGFITVGKSGISDIEIEDALSCDDKVLDEVYRFHDPPVQGIIRIPPVLWARIKYDIKEYIVERLSHGKSTLNWYHRQFVQTARARYATDEKAVYLHKTLSEIFMSAKGVKKSITLSHRKGLYLEDADRQVTPQPFVASNRRKMDALPYHVISAGSLIGPDEAKSELFCNFKFLCTKISAFSVSALISDLNKFAEMSNDGEVMVLRNFLSVCKEDLRSPMRLAVCLLAYIQTNSSQTFLQNLLDQAQQYLSMSNKPLLIPAFACLAPRRDTSQAMTVSLQGFSDIVSDSRESVLLKTRGKREVDDDKADFAILTLTSEELMQLNLPEHAENIPAHLTPTGDIVYYITSSCLVALQVQSEYKRDYAFTDMMPKWDGKTMSVTNFDVNADCTFGVVSFSSGQAVLMDLKQMKRMERFVVNKPNAYVTRALCSSSETDPFVLAIGEIQNSTDDDAQGPGNLSFICKFVTKNEKPVAIIETEAILNPHFCMFLDNESIFVYGASAQDGGYQIVVYKTGSMKQSTIMPLPEEVVSIVGDSSGPLSAALTKSGTLHVVNCSTGEVSLEVKLNHPISAVAVKWEDSLALLGSVQGQITLYDIQNDRHCGAFPAHSTVSHSISIIEDSFISISESFELKSWSFEAIRKDIGTEADSLENAVDESTDLLGQKSVTALTFTPTGDELITCINEGFVRIWSVKSLQLSREFKTGISANHIEATSIGSLVMLDSAKRELQIINLQSGSKSFKHSPPNVIAFTLNSKGDTVITVSSPKEETYRVDILMLQLNKVQKTISLQKGLLFKTLEAKLSASERYLVLTQEVTDEDYKNISDMWSKMYLPQPHRHRFTAIDLTGGTGGLIPCYRQMTKIPSLGNVARAFNGNIMMITTRRSVMFWDIPTGSWTCRSEKKNFRPQGLELQRKGKNTALVHSADRDLVAVGSSDGYVFVYQSKTGIPVGGVNPTTRHQVEVRDYVVKSVDILACFLSGLHTTELVFPIIKTGKCDQKTCRSEKKGFMYRPDWVGQESVGTSQAIVQSENKELCAVGSDDGYVFVYKVNTGLPVGKAKPATKHKAEVIHVSISPNSKWVVSACHNNTVKLWEASTGKEQFSTRVNAEVQTIRFTSDSKYVALYTGTAVTRVIVYRVHSGTC